jgi:hypothetical protein
MRFSRMLMSAAIVAMGVAMCVMVSPAIAFEDKLAAGTYKGTYTGGAGGGNFHLTLKADGNGGLTADVGFTIDGAEVPGKITTLKIDGAKIQMAYDFDLQGAKLQSAIEGTLSGTTLGGTYKTTAEGALVDEGSWKTTVQ